jgi:hypothetical protein
MMRVVWSAANLLWVLAIFMLTQTAWAASQAAVVLTVSGTVSAQSADGKMRTLAKDSKIDAGDIVTTQKSSAARLRFTDGSTVTLRPNSRLVIEQYRFDENNPNADSAVLNLVKGGLRTVTGLVGKRGNRDAYLTKTPAANIGIRGTDFALLLCEVGDETCSLAFKQELLDAIPGRVKGEIPAGLYLAVFDGMIVVFNRAGEKTFPAVSAGFVADFDTMPIELSGDPGLIHLFPLFGNIPGLDELLSGGQNQGACLVR